VNSQGKMSKLQTRTSIQAKMLEAEDIEITAGKLIYRNIVLNKQN